MAQRVVLVVGPPCGGKSTYAWEQADEFAGDMVSDFDVIAQALGSPDSHDHPVKLSHRARHKQRELESWALASPDVRTLYMIRVAADPRDRATVAVDLGAEVVVCAPPRDVVERRARAAGRPAHAFDAIDMWYALNAEASA